MRFISSDWKLGPFLYVGPKVVAFPFRIFAPVIVSEHEAAVEVIAGKVFLFPGCFLAEVMESAGGTFFLCEFVLFDCSFLVYCFFERTLSVAHS